MNWSLTVLESNMAITYLDSSSLTSALGGVKSLGWARKLISLGTHPAHPAVSLLWSSLVEFQTSRGSSEQGPAGLVWVKGGVTVPL